MATDTVSAPAGVINEEEDEALTPEEMARDAIEDDLIEAWTPDVDAYLAQLVLLERKIVATLAEATAKRFPGKPARFYEAILRDRMNDQGCFGSTKAAGFWSVGELRNALLDKALALPTFN